VASSPKPAARLCQSGPRGAPADVRPFFRASLPRWQEQGWSPRPPAPASTRLSAAPPLGRHTRQSKLDGAAAEPWRWSGVRMGRSHQSARAGTPCQAEQADHGWLRCHYVLFRGLILVCLLSIWFKQTHFASAKNVFFLYHVARRAVIC
jgi:hypothetical protein